MVLVFLRSGEVLSRRGLLLRGRMLDSHMGWLLGRRGRLLVVAGRRVSHSLDYSVGRLKLGRVAVHVGTRWLGLLHVVLLILVVWLGLGLLIGKLLRLFFFFAQFGGLTLGVTGCFLHVVTHLAVAISPFLRHDLTHVVLVEVKQLLVDCVHIDGGLLSKLLPVSLALLVCLLSLLLVVVESTYF